MSLMCYYLIDHHDYTVQDSRHPGGCSRLITQEHKVRFLDLISIFQDVLYNYWRGRKSQLTPLVDDFHEHVFYERRSFGKPLTLSCELKSQNSLSWFNCIFWC